MSLWETLLLLLIISVILAAGNAGDCIFRTDMWQWILTTAAIAVPCSRLPASVLEGATEGERGCPSPAFVQDVSESPPPLPVGENLEVCVICCCWQSPLCPSAGDWAGSNILNICRICPPVWSQWSRRPFWTAGFFWFAGWSVAQNYII